MGYYLGYIICGFVIIIAIIIAGCAQVKVSSSFNEYKDKTSSLDLTGSQLAQRLADKYGLNINICMIQGRLTDNYNSQTKTLSISQENYDSKSIAAQSIVAHEFGHALQDAKSYKPLYVRQLIVKASNFISSLLLPMIILGVIMELFLFAGGYIIVYAYVAIYAVSVIASLVTLPVEFNASSRAKILLQEEGCTSEEEKRATNKLLGAAAMTYVAGLLVSLAYFLRLLFLLLAIIKDN